jgi:hypothetical protein
MNDLNDARQWHEEVRHLVQAHGADPDRLTSFTLTLDQVHFVHFDTHAALDIAELRPPDGHTHPVRLDPGRSGRAAAPSYRPFPPSASAQEDALFESWSISGRCDYLLAPAQTSLPQTCLWPRTEADLADWASAAVGITLAFCERLDDGYNRDQVVARIRGNIKGPAAAAAARLLVRAGFPAAPPLPGTGAARTPRQPQGAGPPPGQGAVSAPASVWHRRVLSELREVPATDQAGPGQSAGRS